MATTTPAHVVNGAVDLDIDFPDEREYERKADAELDRQMLATIEAARDAGDDHIADVLALELGSHYYSTR